MPPIASLFPIVAASVAGGLISLAAVGLASLTIRPQWVPHLVSYAVGSLLGASFLEVLPHALENNPHPERLMAMVLGGILLFFLLEKMVLWRHSHGDEDMHGHGDDGHHHHAHGHSHGVSDGDRGARMILIGDTFHNFVDGILIAAAFLSDFKLGVVTAVAIIAHEIPQEVGDFAVLLQSGLSRTRAFFYNAASSLATLLGGILGWVMLGQVMQWVPAMLALAAASMIYVAVADLIPGLHRKRGAADSVLQVLLIALGIGAIGLIHLALGHTH